MLTIGTAGTAGTGMTFIYSAPARSRTSLVYNVACQPVPVVGLPLPCHSVRSVQTRRMSAGACTMSPVPRPPEAVPVPFDVNCLSEEEKKNIMIVCGDCKVPMKGLAATSSHRCKPETKAQPEFAIVHPHIMPESFNSKIEEQPQNPNMQAVPEWSANATKCLINFYTARKDEFKYPEHTEQFWHSVTMDLNRYKYRVAVHDVQRKFGALYEIYRECLHSGRRNFEYYDMMHKIFGVRESEKVLSLVPATSTSKSPIEESRTKKKARLSGVGLDIGTRWLEYLNKARDSEEAQLVYLKRKGEIEEVRLALEKEKLLMMRRSLVKKERRTREKQEMRKEEMEIRREKLQLLKKMVHSMN